MKRAIIGIKTRTGRAVAVALSAPLEFVCREELTLCDDVTKQPYHDVMELPWNESVIAVKPAVATIEKIAARELRRLLVALLPLGLAHGLLVQVDQQHVFHLCTSIK